MNPQYNNRTIRNDFEGDVLRPKEGMFRRKPKLPMSIDSVINALKDGLMVSSNRFVISHKDDVVSVTDTSLTDHRRTKTASLAEYRSYLESKGDKFIHCTIKTKDVTMVRPDNISVSTFVTDSLITKTSKVRGLDWGTIFPRDLPGDWLNDVYVYYQDVKATGDCNNSNGWNGAIAPVRNDVGLVWQAVQDSFNVQLLVIRDGAIVKETKVVYDHVSDKFTVHYETAGFSWKYINEVIDTNDSCILKPMRYLDYSRAGINVNVADTIIGLRAISNPAVKAVRVPRTLVFVNYDDLLNGYAGVTKDDIESIDALVLPTDIAWLNGTYVYPKMCKNGIYLECLKHGVNLHINTTKGTITVGVSTIDKRVCVTGDIDMNLTQPLEYDKPFWAMKVFQFEMVMHFYQTSCEEFYFTSDQFEI